MTKFNKLLQRIYTKSVSLSVHRWCICMGLLVEIAGRIGSHIIKILTNVTRGGLMCMTSCVHIVIIIDLVTAVIHDRVSKFDKAHTTKIKLTNIFCH